MVEDQEESIELTETKDIQPSESYIDHERSRTQMQNVSSRQSFG